MVTKRRVSFVMLVSGLIACSSSDVSEVEDFSINGGRCSETRAITLDGVSGKEMPDKTLALTFDDGPSEVTAELSAYLAEQNIRATFFINGKYVLEGREKILDQQVNDGHLLGNHTQTHPYLTQISANDVIVEVESTDKLLAQRVPQDKLFFRPPFGDWNEAVTKTLANSPMQKYQGPVGWDIGDQLTATTAADWDCWDAQNGTRTMAECGDLYVKEIEAKRHGIVLLHDGPPDGEGAKTVKMVKYIVPRLKAAGYSFARIDEVPIQPPVRSPVAETPDAPAPPADDPCSK